MGQAINRAILYEQLRYAERGIAAGEEAIEKQRQGIARLEATVPDSVRFRSLGRCWRPWNERRRFTSPIGTGFADCSTYGRRRRAQGLAQIGRYWIDGI